MSSHDPPQNPAPPDDSTPPDPSGGPNKRLRILQALEHVQVALMYLNVVEFVSHHHATPTDMVEVAQLLVAIALHAVGSGRER